MKQKDDYLWKGVLEDVFDDFLRFLYPDADSVFDLSRGITFLDKELEMNFLRYYVRFDNSEVNTIFEQEVEKLTERSHTMGIEELLLNRAKKEGKRESLISVAREMKKDGIPVEQIVKFTKLSIKEIEKL